MVCGALLRTLGNSETRGSRFTVFSISVYVLQSCIGTIAFTRLEGMENIFLDTLRFCTLAFFNVLIISTEERLKCTKCFF